MSTARPVATRFPCFDGLRIIAALSVFAFHFLFLGPTEPVWLRGRTQAAAWAFGGQGVAIFFVISGFLLYRPFAMSHFAKIPHPRLAPFWTRRTFRVFPAYWIALSASVFVLRVTTIRGSGQFLAFYTLTQGYHRGLELGGLGVAWTLVIEVCFYATLPFIAGALRALGGSHSSTTRTLCGELLGLLLLVAVGAGSRAWWVWASPRPAFPLPYALIWYLDVFVLGLLLAIASAWHATGGRLPAPIEALGRFPWLCWATAIAVYVWSSPLAGGGAHHPPVSRFVLFVLPPLRGMIALLLVAPAVFGDQRAGTIRSVLRSRPAAYLGRISYGVYLWHLTLIHVIARWINHGSLSTDPWLRLVVTAALTLTAATLSYYVVERPVIGVGRRWT